MKKIIAILMTIAMLASIAAVSVNADTGQLLLVDTFEDNSFIDANWAAEASLFYIEDGWAKADRHGVVHQSNFVDGGKEWDYFSASVDIAFYDYDSDNEDGDVGLWYKDYQLLPGEEMPDDYTDLASGIVYRVELYAGLRQVRLTYREEGMEVEEETEESEETEETETTETTAETTNKFGHEGDVVMYYDLPADYEIDMDFFEPSIHNLGMRVEPDGISAYLDGKFLFKYNTPNTLGTVRRSPICLLNEGSMIVGFDNFKVATVDYPLFASDLEPDPQPAVTNPIPTPAPVETKVETQKVIVTDVETNEAGETVIVTREEIVSNVVTVPVADTNTGGTVGGTGAATGDMMFVVVAVMVVAVGSAIVVKKVRVK